MGVDVVIGVQPLSEEFVAFYERARLPMVRLAHIILGSNAVAEEVVQDALIDLYRRGTAVLNPDAYLRTSVVNRCRSQLRRRALEQRHLEAPATVLEAPELDETWHAVLELPFRQRAVLVLRYYNDLTEPEIARTLGCRLGTVKSAHHRAIATLRRRLT